MELIFILLSVSLLTICGVAAAKVMEQREMSRFQHCEAMVGQHSKTIRVSASKLPEEGESLRCLVAVEPQPWPRRDSFEWCTLANHGRQFTVTH